MLKNIRQDLRASCEGSITIRKVLLHLFADTDFRVVMHYRINRWFFCHGLKIIAYFRNYRIKKIYGVEISPMAKIGPGFRIVHGLGTVIGNECTIGKNCVIYNQVTMGVSWAHGSQAKYPIIGDDVIVYSGAKILGGVRVGCGAVIAANAVVIRDVEDHTVIAGVPGRIITIGEEAKGI